MTDFFAMLHDEERAPIRNLMRRCRFNRHQVFAADGVSGPGFHVVESGWFLVTAVTADGRTLGMTIEGPGGAFGEFGLLPELDGITATARALRPAVTLTLEHESVAELRATAPHINEFLIALLASRVERLVNQLAEAAGTATRKRLSRLLLRLDGVFDPDPIYLTQAEIASLAFSTRQTVSTLLGDLAKQDLVETGRGQLRVLNREGLRRYAEG